MRLSFPLFLLLNVGLLGCTPANLVRLNMPPESERAEVQVYREPAFNASGIGLLFGAGNKDFVQLSNGEYARLYLPAGAHSFFARSTQADKPYELAISLVANQKTCLKASANSKNLAKTLLPLAYYLSSTFQLEQVNCLSDVEIAKYSLVPVEYETK